MIPTHWFRKIIATLVLLELGVVLVYLFSCLFSGPTTRPIGQNLAAIFFMLGFYGLAPVIASFLAPHPTSSKDKQQRLDDVLKTVPGKWEVMLYDHKDKEANTVGITPEFSRVYITSGLEASLSDQGLRGVIAHEFTHIKECHIFFLFFCVCAFILAGSLLRSSNLFIFAFVVFMTVRRYLEYRADAGAARMVGKEVVITALRELQAINPESKWIRRLVLVAAYPTLSMRIKALETGKKIWF